MSLTTSSSSGSSSFKSKSLKKRGQASKPSKTNVTVANGEPDVDMRWSSCFIPDEPVPPFRWKPPPLESGINLAQDSFTCISLLMNDFFIDKSKALYCLLKRYYDRDAKDFRPQPLLLAYPRRFSKTTLLGLIEAVFSPLPKLEVYDSIKVKTKIAALEKGKALLNFGLHPVLYLDLHRISSVDKLNMHIEVRLGKAGLSKVSFRKSMSPADRVITGVQMLNEKFIAETGIETKTIVVIDEYDKPFRNRDRKSNDRLLAEIIELFSLGKEKDGGISLLVLCGLTRMVGTGLSELNNLVDVSRQTMYHGLCGISATELVLCAGTQLDDASKRMHQLTFADALEQKFRPAWNGFRFGIDNQIGELDPETYNGALFSPLDVWEIVRSLSDNDLEPSSRWIRTMHAEFEFSSFAKKYTSSRKALNKLYANLLGGWMTRDQLTKQMSRKEYMTLGSDIDVQKVLFELGLLTVKELHGDFVRLYPPNWMVTRNAMQLLVGETRLGETPEELAKAYLSASGFGGFVSRAAKNISNNYKETGENVLREYPFQDFLLMELLSGFPDDGKCSKYKVYNE